MCRHKKPYRELLIWRQCIKQATSLKEQTGKTEPISSTRRTEQYNLGCAGCGPTFELNLPRLHSETAGDRLETTNLITILPIRGCLAATSGDIHGQFQVKSYQ